MWLKAKNRNPLLWVLLSSVNGGKLESEVLSGGLVSSPGHGVVDSGCGKIPTIPIGVDTLQQLSQLIEAKGYCPIKYNSEDNGF